MDEIEELKKKFQCEKCHKPYNGDSVIWIYTSCQHHSCESCYESISTDGCLICNCSTNETRTTLSKHIVRNHKSSIVNYASALRDEIIILKEKVSMLEAPKEDHHKCAECEKSDYEKDLQLCETCHGLKFENLKDVKSHALCASCAIKKHMRQGHQTVDFYPYLSAHNFSSHSSRIDSKSEEYKSAQNLLNNTFTSFNTFSANVLENFNVLTDMARRSKNTKQQVKFFEKMEKFMDESKSINVETASAVKKRTMKLEDNLTKIKKWCESRLENCVGESEIIKLPNSDDSDKNDVDA